MQPQRDQNERDRWACSNKLNLSWDQAMPMKNETWLGP
jgi:hypothetical protein